MFLSLETHRGSSPEIEIFRNLLHKNVSKHVFEKWASLRNLIFAVLKVPPSSKNNLDKHFLDSSLMIVVVNRILGPEKIAVIRKWLQVQHKLIKKATLAERKGEQNLVNPTLIKNQKLYRLESTSASIIARRILDIIIEEDIEKTRRMEGYYTRSESSFSSRDGDNYDVVEVEDDNSETLQPHHVSLLNKTKSKSDYRYLEDLKRRRDLLVSEVSNLTKESNCKRQAMIMLVGLTKAFDPLVTEGREKMNYIAKDANIPRQTVKDEDLLKILFRLSGALNGELFFTRGSKLQAGLFKDMCYKIDITSFKIGKDIVFRSHGYYTKTLRFKDLYENLLNLNKDAFLEKKVGGNERREKALANAQEGIDFYEIKAKHHFNEKPQIQEHEEHEISVDLDNQVNESHEGFNAIMRYASLTGNSSKFGLFPIEDQYEPDDVIELDDEEFNVINKEPQQLQEVNSPTIDNVNYKIEEGEPNPNKHEEDVFINQHPSMSNNNDEIREDNMAISLDKQTDKGESLVHNTNTEVKEDDSYVDGRDVQKNPLPLLSNQLDDDLSKGFDSMHSERERESTLAKDDASSNDKREEDGASQQNKAPLIVFQRPNSEEEEYQSDSKSLELNNPNSQKQNDADTLKSMNIDNEEEQDVVDINKHSQSSLPKQLDNSLSQGFDSMFSKEDNQAQPNNTDDKKQDEVQIEEVSQTPLSEDVEDNKGSNPGEAL